MFKIILFWEKNIFHNLQLYLKIFEGQFVRLKFQNIFDMLNVQIIIVSKICLHYHQVLIED